MTDSTDIAILKERWGRPIKPAISEFFTLTKPITAFPPNGRVDAAPIRISSNPVTKDVVGARLVGAEIYTVADGYFTQFGITCDELANYALYGEPLAVVQLPILGFLSSNRSATAAGFADVAPQTSLNFVESDVVSQLFQFAQPKSIDSLTLGIFNNSAAAPFTVGSNFYIRARIILYTLN